MQEYLDLLKKVKDSGKPKGDRTGTGTISIFGHQMRFDLQESFPLLTTKKIHFKSVAYELLWFLKGDTNIKYLKDNGVSIWDEWADENGDLGPVYGIPSMALAPCHILFQFYVQEGKLSCQLYQRSADVFLGVPFNIASYALLTHMIANVCNLEVGDFVHTLGDAHLYNNHLTQAEEQLSRSPLEPPQIKVSQKTSIDAYEFEDFELINYQHHPHIPAVVAV